MLEITKKNLCYTVFYIVLWLSTPCYAQINLNVKGLYKYNSYVHKQEMIFALGWVTGYIYLFDRRLINSSSLYEVDLCDEYKYTRIPIIYDLTELLVKNNYDFVKNIWFPAPKFIYNSINFDKCSINNFLNFLVSSVVKDSLNYNQINVLPSSDNKLTLSASKVARKVHVNEIRYNELYLFKCKVSYFTGPSTFINIPNLRVKYKQITRDNNFEKYFDDITHKGLFYNKFDHVMHGLISTPMKGLLFKEQKIIFNYIYDISEIEVFPVSEVKVYKKQIKSRLN